MGSDAVDRVKIKFGYIPTLKVKCKNNKQN